MYILYSYMDPLGLIVVLTRESLHGVVRHQTSLAYTTLNSWPLLRMKHPGLASMSGKSPQEAGAFGGKLPASPPQNESASGMCDPAPCTGHHSRGPARRYQASCSRRDTKDWRKHPCSGHPYLSLLQAPRNRALGEAYASMPKCTPRSSMPLYGMYSDPKVVIWSYGFHCKAFCYAIQLQEPFGMHSYLCLPRCIYMGIYMYILHIYMYTGTNQHNVCTCIYMSTVMA